MKLIVAGATGLVATEIIRQSLQIAEITSVIALARKPIKVDESPHSSKLKSVVVSDYAEYPDHVKADFAGADACIWYVSLTLSLLQRDMLTGISRTVAVTPFRMSSFDFAEVKRVCQDCTVAGFKAMYEAGPVRPFRFVYFSADGTPRDLTKKPFIMGEYQIMRVSAWNSRSLSFGTDGDVCASR